MPGALPRRATCTARSQRASTATRCVGGRVNGCTGQSAAMPILNSCWHCFGGEGGPLCLPLSLSPAFSNAATTTRRRRLLAVRHHLNVPPLLAVHHNTKPMPLLAVDHQTPRRSLPSGITQKQRRDLQLTTNRCADPDLAVQVGKHRHMPEIEQGLSEAAGKPVNVSFTPHLINMSRCERCPHLRTRLASPVVVRLLDS